MHEYDITLKDLLLDAPGITLRELTGLDVTMWRDVETENQQSANRPAWPDR